MTQPPFWLPDHKVCISYYTQVLNSLLSFLIELLKHKRLVSSAMWWTLQNFIAWLRSFIYNKNRRGPRTDPWGMSQFIVVKPESKPFMDTYWLWLDRQDLTNHLKLHESRVWFRKIIWALIVMHAEGMSKCSWGLGEHCEPLQWV